MSSGKKGFSKTFFSYCIDEWNRLNPEIRNVKSICKFKKLIITQKLENSLYNVHDRIGVKLLSHLRLQFTHNLNKHKFRHGFNDTVNPTCPDVYLKLMYKPLNIFSFVDIVFLPRDPNSLIIFTDLIHLLQN